MNDKGVYRTAPATKGLLNIWKKKKVDQVGPVDNRPTTA